MIVPAPVIAPEAPVKDTPMPVADAAPAPRAARVTAHADRFLSGGYLDLLWLDHYVGEILGTYPGAPTTNRYSSFTYKWESPDLDKLEKVLRAAHETAQNPLDNQPTQTDHAVGAYTRQALDVWSDLQGLVDYYQLRRYVDDEFARGRRDGRIVADAIAKLGPLRAPMVEAVFAGWRIAAGDKAESARAIAGASFEACMRAAYLVFAAHAKVRGKTSPAQDPGVEAAIDAGMSACRKGVGAVSALPEGFYSFSKALRDAAVAFGDASHEAWAVKYADDDLEQLVQKYIAEWPKLPAEPAEQPGER